MQEPKKARKPGRYTLLAGALLIALGVLSINAYATFTATTSVTQTTPFTAGHMSITVPASGATDRLYTGASGIAPGDTMQRVVDVTVDNSTTSGILTALKVAISASPSSTLDTDATNGLQVWVQKCSTAYSESGPPYTYTCGGSTADVIGTSGSPVAISTLTSATTLTGVSTTPNVTSHLRFYFTFPSTAGDSFQDASSTLTFTFSGTQRAGTDQ